MRVYIAGALSSKEQKDRNPSKIVTDYIQNISSMCKVASRVRRLGHSPYVPGLDFLIGVIIGDWEEEDYREMGMSFLGVCDAVLVTSMSWGVQQEIDKALDLDIPVVFRVEDLENVRG